MGLDTAALQAWCYNHQTSKSTTQIQWWQHIEGKFLFLQQTFSQHVCIYTSHLFYIQLQSSYFLRRHQVFIKKIFLPPLFNNFLTNGFLNLFFMINSTPDSFSPWPSQSFLYRNMLHRDVVMMALNSYNATSQLIFVEVEVRNSNHSNVYKYRKCI